MLDNNHYVYSGNYGINLIYLNLCENNLCFMEMEVLLMLKY